MSRDLASGETVLNAPGPRLLPTTGPRSTPIRAHKAHQNTQRGTAIAGALAPTPPIREPWPHDNVSHVPSYAIDACRSCFRNPSLPETRLHPRANRSLPSTPFRVPDSEVRPQNTPDKNLLRCATHLRATGAAPSPWVDLSSSSGPKVRDPWLRRSEALRGTAMRRTAQAQIRCLSLLTKCAKKESQPPTT